MGLLALDSCSRILTLSCRESKDDSLPGLTSAIRSCIKSVTPEYSADLSAWVAGLVDNTRTQHNISDFLVIVLGFLVGRVGARTRGTNVVLKLPKVLHSSFQTFEKFAVLLTSRACQVGGDEGLEISIYLETESANILKEDKIML